VNQLVSLRQNEATRWWGNDAKEMAANNGAERDRREFGRSKRAKRRGKADGEVQARFELVVLCKTWG
jgi:hypothetical protein